MPYPSYAAGDPLRPIPNSNRPSLIWSSVAVSSAIRMGSVRGKTCTAVPIVTRSVRAAIAEPTAINEVSTARSGVK